MESRLLSIRPTDMCYILVFTAVHLTALHAVTLRRTAQCNTRVSERL